MEEVADSVLISDFDGTITERDFFDLIRERHMPAGAPDFLAEWRAGRRTHFDAMAAYFAYAPADTEALEALLRGTKPDPGLEAASSHLARCGWDLVVVSAGSSWYIERILDRHNVRAVVHANPGRIEKGRGLVIERPAGSPFFSHEVGVDKRAVVEDALRRYRRVAFAGDGRPDLPPALRVAPQLRFARGFLASELARRGKRFRPFERWTEVVAALTC